VKRSLVAWCAALLLSLCHLVPTASAAPPEEEAATSVPVLAYYYQWFTPKSWDRAKIDYPLAGRYSSDDVSIMQRHIAEAKSAGIGGFIVSWKSTATNNRRLEALIKVARAADFKLAIIYQGLTSIGTLNRCNGSQRTSISLSSATRRTRFFTSSLSPC
jgi:hypothetical protein